MVKERLNSLQTTLCTFGKHPGWDDHMERLGLDMDALISFHKILYDVGINSNIGVWEELGKKAEFTLIPFAHDFYWQCGKDSILGRLWYSKDGKGRDRYPMVVCVHSRDLTASQLIQFIYPIITKTEELYKAASSESEVKSIFETTKKELHQITKNIPSLKEKDRSLESENSFKKIYNSKAINRSLEEFCRLLFTIENNLSLKLNTDKDRFRSNLLPIRMPICSQSFSESLSLWDRFLSSQVSTNTPKIFFYPNNQEWCDLIVGEPLAKEFNCLRLPLEKLPLNSSDPSVPCPENFKTRVHEHIQKILSQENSGKISSFLKIKKRQTEENSHVQKLKDVVSDTFNEERDEIEKGYLKKILIALGILFVLVFLAAFILFQPQKPKTQEAKRSDKPTPQKTRTENQKKLGFDPQTWENLCINYHTWFGSFQKKMSEKKRPAWNADENLKEAIHLLTTAEAEALTIDPIQIANTKGSYDYLSKNPPESSKSPDAWEQTKIANEFVEQIATLLIEKKSRIAEFFSSKIKRYDELRWTAAKKIFAAHGESFPLDKNQDLSGITILLDQYFENKDKLDEVDRLTEEILLQKSTIEHSKDEILSKINAFISASIQDVNDLAELAEKLRHLLKRENILFELTTFLQKQWNQKSFDHSLFKQESNVYRNFSGTIDKSEIVAWLDEVKDYKRIDPKRIDAAEKKWMKSFADFEDDIRWLAEMKSEKIKTFNEKLDTLKAQGKISLPLVAKYQIEIQNTIDNFNNSLITFQEELEHEKIDLAGNPCEWLVNVQMFSFKRSEILQAAWEKRKNSILMDVSCRQLEKNPDRYPSLRTRIQKLQNFLVQVERLVSSVDDRSLRELKKDNRKNLEYMYLHREETYKKALVLSEWSENVPIGDFDQFQKSVKGKELFESYKNWFSQTLDAISTFQTLADKLDEGYLLEEKFNFREQQISCLTLYESWSNKPSFKEDNLGKGLLQPVVKRISRVMNIENERNLKKLKQIAEKTGAELVEIRTAWKRLGTLGWPNQQDDRNALKQMKSNMIAKINSVKNPSRAEALLAITEKESLLYESRTISIVINDMLEKMNSNLQKLKVELGNSEEQVQALMESQKEIVGERNSMTSELKNREVEQEDIKSLNILLAKSHRLRKQIEAAQNPWPKIENLQNTESIPDGDHIINEEWLYWRKEILSKESKEKIENDKTYGHKILSRSQNIYDFLRQMANDPDILNDPCNRHNARISENAWAAQITQVFNTYRQTSIREHFLQNPDPSMDSLKTKFREWKNLHCEFLSDFLEIETLLDAGFPLKKKKGTISVLDLYEKWQPKLVGMSESKHLPAPIEKRVLTLQALSNLDGRQTLTKVNEEKIKRNPEIVTTLWEKTRILEHWPQNLEELKEEVFLRKTIPEICEKLREIDPDFAKQFMKELEKEKMTRWEKVITKLKKNHEIEEAILLKSAFPIQEEKLEANVVFNLLFNQFKHMDLSDYEDREVIQVCNDFTKSIKDHSKPLDEIEEVAKLLTSINKELANTDPSSDFPIDKLRPMSSILANQFAPRILKKGKRIEFKWNKDPGREELNLVFELIVPQDNLIKPFYISTFEISLGLFIHTMELAEKWEEIAEGIPDAASDDYREGPWAWDWNNGENKIHVREEWVNTPSLGENPKEYYPQNEYPKGPTASSPIHQISPQLALYFSLLIGCRLPSSQEWILALESTATPVEGNNLRGHTWKRQKQHVLKLKQRGKTIFFPEHDAFLPMTFREKNTDDLETFTENDDGLLWFDAINSEAKGAFYHLIGNVAEFTFSKPQILEKLFKNKSTITLETVDQFVKKHASGFNVIGGSALSGPEVDVFIPYPIDQSEEFVTFSDVGFRLAFTAPKISLASRIKVLLEKQSYLLN